MAYVQFSDSSKAKIISTFASPQDEGVYENYGEVEETDKRYLAYLQLPKWNALQGRASTALRDSDTVLMNFFSQGKQPTSDWAEYRGKLRAILDADQGDPEMGLPSPPAS
ncbi:hypothetical protein [Pantoea ananatis]|uniref:hypothetical protein n=1 Tax=Pantoea ananas TaxID=553 RepID=UPI000CF4BE0C|nr:hypothetical protein [Pantoea ananatis]PQK95853.1 hypothetical protein CG433_03395 [Pantoea ananatis]